MGRVSPAQMGHTGEGREVEDGVKLMVQGGCGEAAWAQERLRQGRRGWPQALAHPYLSGKVHTPGFG